MYNRWVHWKVFWKFIGHGGGVSVLLEAGKKLVKSSRKLVKKLWTITDNCRCDPFLPQRFVKSIFIQQIVRSALTATKKPNRDSV